MLSALKTKVEDVEKSTALLRKQKTSLEKESSKHELNLKETTLSIQQIYKDLNGELKIRENKLITDLHQKSKSTVNALKKQREATEDSLAQIESAMEYFKQMESKSDDCEVLFAGPVLVKSLEALAAVDLTQDVHQPTWNFSPGQLIDWISKVQNEGNITSTVDVEEEIVMEDMMFLLGPRMNWHEMLNPAPLSVCLLGQLVLVTLEKDVSLVSNNMERKEFIHVRHPESLRTSMVQVANEGWSAFNTANKNMDQIRLLTLQVPQHVKKSVKLIIGGSVEEIEELVPDILRNVTRISETCTEKTQEVETQMTNVKELIGELQEAFTLAKYEYEQKTQKKAEEGIEMVLKAGIKALGEVKTQWGKLIRFFQTMYNLIEFNMDNNVRIVFQISEECKQSRLDYSLSVMLRDLIFTQASETNKIAFMVNNLSAMYVEVSEKHIMDQVASLGQLLALDPKTEKSLIVQKQLSLGRQAQEATSSIADIVRQKQNEFDTRIQKRVQTIETEMRAVLPPPKPADPEMEAEINRAIEDAQEVKKEEQQVDDWV